MSSVHRTNTYLRSALTALGPTRLWWNGFGSTGNYQAAAFVSERRRKATRQTHHTVVFIVFITFELGVLGLPLSVFHCVYNRIGWGDNSMEIDSFFSVSELAHLFFFSPPSKSLARIYWEAFDYCERLLDLIITLLVISFFFSRPGPWQHTSNCLKLNASQLTNLSTTNWANY